MNNVPKLTNKELEKWIGILGTEAILVLVIDSKIHLTKKQLKEYIGIEIPEKRKGRG